MEDFFGQRKGQYSSKNKNIITIIIFIIINANQNFWNKWRNCNIAASYAVLKNSNYETYAKINSWIEMGYLLMPYILATEVYFTYYTIWIH